MLWKESGPTSQTLVFMAQLATNQLCHSGHLIFQGAGTRQEQQDLVRRKGERETSLVPGTCFPMTQTSRRQEPLVIKKKKNKKNNYLFIWCVGSQSWCVGLVAPWHVASQFPNEGSNLHPLHWKVHSQSPDHQGKFQSSHHFIVYYTSRVGLYCVLKKKLSSK